MTDKRLNEILKSLTVIIDTRENENSHIIKYFDRFNVPYISRKLDFGDYSFICPEIPELGVDEPKSYENHLIIERKGSLTELSGNLTQQRERFENELIRAKEAGAKLILMVEDGDFEKIMRHEYRTDFNEKAFAASLFSFQARYGMEIQFIPSIMAGWLIFGRFRYFLREEIKQLEAAEVC